MTRKIKSAKILKYDYHLVDAWESEIKVEPYLFNETEYDNFGNVVLEVTHSADFSSTSKTERKFDEHGHLIEEIMWDENDEIMERTTYERDEGGKIIHHFEHYLDESFDTTDYEYDADFNLIKKTTINDEDEVEGHEIFEYSNGLLIKSEEYDENGKVVSGSEYEYDEYGNIIEQSSRTLEGGSVRLVSEYDEKNRRIKQLRYNDIGRLVEKTLYEYDENGRLSELLEEDETKKNITRFTVDEQGRPIWQIETDRFEQEVLKVERQYDEDGNITMLTAYIKSPGNYPDQNYILKYEYEYFD